MRSSSFAFLILVPALGVFAACGNGSGVVIGSDDGGTADAGNPAPVDCAVGPNFTGCACKAGETRPCYTGPGTTRGIGTCKDGVQTCAQGSDGTYAFGACSGETLPTPASTCTVDAGGCEVPVHCLAGYAFDPKTCQCLPAADGGSGAICGGIAGAPCAHGFYCDGYPDTDPCGGGDSTGTCTAQGALGCVPDGTPTVCGCDNKPYINACEAHSAGTAVRKTGGC